MLIAPTVLLRSRPARLKSALAAGFLLIFMIGNAQAAVPAPPQNLQPAWLFGEVMLTWNEVPEATSYTVHRYDANSAAWAPIATGLTLPRYRDEGVYDPQSYTVTAVNAEGESGPAEPVVAEQTGDSFLAML